MDQPRYRILFLCTGNSARSVLAEALMNHLGAGRFQAFSAGSHPTGKVNPMAIQVLQELNIPVGNPRSKSWDEFANADAAPIDMIITVCDNAANEACPIWPGKPITAHWGVEDPAAVVGDDDKKRRAFLDALNVLKRRIELFLSLPIAKLDRMALLSRVKTIGQQ